MLPTVAASFFYKFLQGAVLAQSWRMLFLFSWGIGSPPSPRKTAETSEEMEYANTLIINFSIKWSFVVHTIIQFLVKSHFHVFPLSYRNILGWYSSFADLAGISGWFSITFSTEEQTAISQIPQKPQVCSSTWDLVTSFQKPYSLYK